MVERANGIRRTLRRSLGVVCYVNAEWRAQTMATEAYCVKCREKREMQDAKEVTMKNGRNAMEGKCPVCGTKLFRMVGKKAAA